MKQVKKFLAFLLAAVLVISLGSLTAYATDEEPVAQPTSGSVQVASPNAGQTYTLYKLFDARMSFDDDGNMIAVTYTLPEGKDEDALKYKVSESDVRQWFKVENGYVVAADGVNAQWAKDADAMAWARAFGVKVAGKDPITAVSAETEVKWADLPYGYYFVDSSLGSFVSVDSNNPNVTVQDKNNPPTLDKEITAVSHGSISNVTGEGEAASAEMADVGQGANEHAIAQIGDTITYKLTIGAKPGAENYVVTDTLAAGLTPPAASAVSVKAGEAALEGADYTVDVTGQVITVSFANAFLNTISADMTITIEYTATLNKDAVVASNSNDNSARLEWGHKTVKDYTEDQSKVWTAEITVFKVDDKSAALAGAGFVLKNADNKYYKYNEEAVDAVPAQGTEGASDYVPAKDAQPAGVVWVDSVEDATEYITEVKEETVGDKTEKVAKITFTGLANGTYTLVEKTVPAGYNEAREISAITIAAGNYSVENLSQSKKIVNMAGTELPSTGGIGTTIFYVVGGLLLVVGGVLLVTKKRVDNDK